MTNQPLSPEELTRLQRLLWEQPPGDVDDRAWDEFVRGAIAADSTQTHGSLEAGDLVPAEWPSGLDADDPSHDVAAPDAVDDGDAGDWAGGLFDDPGHPGSDDPHHDHGDFHEGD